jgi:hypothetical protein
MPMDIPGLAKLSGETSPPFIREARATARTGSGQDTLACNVTLAEELIIQQLSQPDRRRGGENVTTMLYYSGRSVRCRTGASISTLMLVLSRPFDMAGPYASHEPVIGGHLHAHSVVRPEEFCREFATVRATRKAKMAHSGSGPLVTWRLASACTFTFAEPDAAARPLAEPSAQADGDNGSRPPIVVRRLAAVALRRQSSGGTL